MENNLYRWVKAGDGVPHNPAMKQWRYVPTGEPVLWEQAKRFALTEDNSDQVEWLEPIEESEQDEFKYPTYEQSGGSKEWDDMNELEKANYNLCKALNAIAVSKTTIKRLREKLNANN